MTSSQLTADLIEVTAITEAIVADRPGGSRDGRGDATLQEITRAAMALELGTRYQPGQIETLLAGAEEEGWVELRNGRWRATPAGSSQLDRA